MKKAIMFIIFLFFAKAHTYANAQPQTFHLFPNEYFVETGSFTGDAIGWALDAGFKHVYSVELDPTLHNNCKRKFARFRQVKLFLGDSSALLYDMIKDINTTITFWLDAHYCAQNSAKGDVNSPILLELEAIKKHPIKNHTILIDDVRDLGTAAFDFVTLDQLIAKIMGINANYKISFVDGYVPNDILVAQVR